MNQIRKNQVLLWVITLIDNNGVLGVRILSLYHQQKLPNRVNGHSKARSFSIHLSIRMFSLFRGSIVGS